MSARVVLLLALVGCGGASAGTSTGEARDVSQIHRARCGACHTRVEPKTRTRAQLEAAFVRHRRRVRMTEEEWGRMVDYLASDPK